MVSSLMDAGSGPLPIQLCSCAWEINGRESAILWETKMKLLEPGFLLDQQATDVVAF